ncbi:Uncharacterised protein [Mycobacterium tuberculosis]|uniref:Uncharacterized protein n=1 Tax=Mycobacterium tuberculosis TaxID=1773 RepID=A0A654TDA8_MYCTX|nr:Uncharacterised protein [Mycobacterium tuberculosis]CFS49440.1 Uncharacterised protein [Mycobacterium tuberculosis]CNL61936.1 Uncharacterised protein [Mycobacterium tuberculosis]CNU30160.1 Uncharacterised protein [Mycobacterium tuberculosis]CNW71714.1 Uncharacterised protein [Mycobacterium tuberculosis]
MEYGDAVGHIQRFGLIVGDQHRGDMHLVVQAAQPGTQLFAHLGIECAERLVEQQHLRIDRQRPGQRHPLSLPTGELIGVAALKSAQAHHLQQIVDLGLDLGLGALTDLQPERHVVTDSQVFERRVVLEDESDATPLWRHPGDVAAVDRDGSGVRLVEAGYGAQQRRLARTAGAQQCGQRTGRYDEIHVVKCDEVAVAFGGVGHDDGVGHFHRLLLSPR